MDTLGDLCGRAIARGRTEESIDWSMITVEPMGLAAKESEFLGVAIVDGRLRSDIHSGGSTIFRVEAGEHTVSVHIKRRFRVAGYRGRAKASLPVSIQPGEHLDLVFGIAKQHNALPKMKALWLTLLFEASLCAAFVIGWLFHPIWRDEVAWATRTVGTQPLWSLWLRVLVSDGLSTAYFALLAWAIVSSVGMLLYVYGPPLDRGNPYFLVRRPHLGKPVAPGKKHREALLE